MHHPADIADARVLRRTRKDEDDGDVIPSTSSELIPVVSAERLTKLLGDREALASFSTEALVAAICAGLEQANSRKATLSSISQFVEGLRKFRADLTGDTGGSDIPSMTVNIQFGQGVSQRPQLVTVGGSDKKLKGTMPSALADIGNIFEGEVCE